MAASNQLEFYMARAAQARAEADAATLDNVRERCLRAVAAWTEMADRATRTEQMRAAREAKPQTLEQATEQPTQQTAEPSK